MANIVRWNDPFAELSNLHSHLDDMFNNFFSAPLADVHGAPTMDVYTEDDKQLVAEVSLPGFDKGDIDINVREGVLEIRGEKHEKEEGKKKRNYMVRESHASFYRSIALPKQARGDEVKANFENGVLKVIVPFKELPKPKKIAIEGGKK